MNASDEVEVLRQMVQQALQQADTERAERVTIRVGVLRKLWLAYEARGAALIPFAEHARDLNEQEPDETLIAIRATCADLRRAQYALS